MGSEMCIRDSSWTLLGVCWDMVGIKYSSPENDTANAASRTAVIDLMPQFDAKWRLASANLAWRVRSVIPMVLGEWAIMALITASWDLKDE